MLSSDNYFETLQPADVELDQVWVLSLPSFTWYKSSYKPSDARMLHTCHIPGTPTPRSQMVAIGGYVPDLKYTLMPKRSMAAG